jgi:hypothetical protein
MMDCARVVRDEITEQYVAGRLPEDDQAAFEQHYFQCGRCFEELKNYRVLRAELDQLSASPRRFPVLSRRQLLWAGAGAAAILAIILLTWRQIRVGDGRVDQVLKPAPATDATPKMDAPLPPRSASEGGATSGIDARIAKVDGTRAYVNIGSSNGVKVGDRFAILHREEQTGTGVVVEVSQKFAIINVTGTAVLGDVIKKL